MINSERDALRERIAKELEAYLAGGGKIEVKETHEFGQPEGIIPDRIRKEDAKRLAYSKRMEKSGKG